MVETWHHGLCAKWWGAFREGGEDAAYFHRLVRDNGAPALDLGCGAGRVLLPILADGLDIEGVDAAPDMLAEARRLAVGRGLTPVLHEQAMHELALPRRYRTIFMCGAIGLGADRAAGLESIRRAWAHLEPGGLFATDVYLPTGDERGWTDWVRPREEYRWSKPDRRALPDGTELWLRTRTTDFDPLEQVWRAEMHLEHRDGDRLIAEESWPLSSVIYLKGEIETMLLAAGFVDIRTTAGVEERSADPYGDHYLMMTARRPAEG